MVARRCPTRAGDGHGRRRRSAVDQDDDRLAAGQVAGEGIIALRLLGVAAAGRDDLAAVEEGVGDRDRLVEEAAGIVAEVEDVALHLVLADVGLDLLDRRLEAVEGLLVERGDADIADLPLFMRAHRLDGDLGTDELHVEGLDDALPLDGERNRGVDAAAHLLDRLVEGHALHLLAVEGGDHVAGEDAGLGGGVSSISETTLTMPSSMVTSMPEAAEFAAGLDLHVLEVLGAEILECGSRLFNIPLIADSIRLVSSGVRRSRRECARRRRRTGSARDKGIGGCGIGSPAREDMTLGQRNRGQRTERGSNEEK
jgi:hypothetical protein